MSLLVSSANLFLYCYYGKRSTNDYAEMAHTLYASNWYQHSAGLQRFFKMMIANAQIPLFYHGFRIVQLNLETYLKVCRKSNLLSVSRKINSIKFCNISNDFFFSYLKRLSVITSCSKHSPRNKTDEFLIQIICLEIIEKMRLHYFTWLQIIKNNGWF